MNAPSFREALLFWLKLGFISFGGPAGQIAIMQTELVEKRRWISQASFLHALNYCMLLPGPEAQQLTIYIGWLLHKTAGGVVAGVLFVLPSMFVLWGLSFVYAAFGQVPWIAAVFYGLKPVVLAIVISAVIRIGKKALRNEVLWLIAALAFLALFLPGAPLPLLAPLTARLPHVPFPAIILAAGLLGWLGGMSRQEKFAPLKGHGEAAETAPHTKPSWSRAFRVSATWLLIWWAPVALVGAWQGTGSTLFRESIFFSKAAVVTFGGAYAVLPYVAQRAVEHFRWLQPGQMMDGLALAETTPGPLIMVLQFVGFMGGWHQPGNLPPLLAASLGALLTTWVTFAPCFLWIFLGAPHIESLRGHTRLSAALTAITAAVVGVILNLAVWFALHVIHPRTGMFDWLALVLAALALAGMLRWKLGVVTVIIAGGMGGFLYRLLSGDLAF